MNEKQNMTIIVTLAVVALYCLYLQQTETASTCVGALAGALTVAMQGGGKHENADSVVSGPADHNGL